MRVMVSPLLERIRRREAKVGVVGLGYVGLPLGMAFAEAGFPVTGLDVDSRKVEGIGRGESYIKHIPSASLKELADSGRLKATTDFSRVGELDCVIICVPTPLTAT
ncbi:MAG TPA: 3-hydroxyacyl-CoA dehydrogenase NAD-binding domain-containing protein, partial [Myxococcaceae bacterium]|nr:3-hydroxyacyl-CoA dehydrogenase NAD-binding domain-containing protein [Myxococcaceae bacterium]